MLPSLKDIQVVVVFDVHGLSAVLWGPNEFTVEQLKREFVLLFFSADRTWDTITIDDVSSEGIKQEFGSRVRFKEDLFVEFLLKYKGFSTAPHTVLNDHEER